MAEIDFNSLQGLELLYTDLCGLIDRQLPVLDRLTDNLEAHLEEFKLLLDKKGKNDESRKKLATGKITIDDVEFSVNEEFQQRTLELADVLDLDELDAAALLEDARDVAERTDTELQEMAVIRYHQRREYIVLCLRRIMKVALDNGEDTLEEDDTLIQAIRLIVGIGGPGTNFAPAHQYWEKCLKSMESIEGSLLQIAERIHSVQVVGVVAHPSFVKIMTFQQQSLTRQHENLAAMCTHMIKAGYASINNFKTLLAKLKKLDRHDLITIHYVPMTIRLLSWIANEENGPLRDLRALDKMLMDGRDSDDWTLRNFHAATIAWWLAEYSGKYMDIGHNDPDLRGVKLEEEAQARSDAFLKALADGALHFMLSFSQDLRPTKWYDPTKTSMITSLLQDTAVLLPDSPQPDTYFEAVVLEQLQMFVDSFITNMPDTLRRLKVEEDDQRKRLNMSFQHSVAEQPLHLERFLVLISYAFDGAPDAAEEFWSDKESNLYGFLQWAAKRQPTPRIAMFCEMLRAISFGEANADSAHQFLMEEGGTSSGKIRRTSSLSYSHIFMELIEFQRNIHEPKKTIQGSLYPPTSQHAQDQIVEPESANMLESYLRLLAHLCRQSQSARTWILDHAEYNFVGICFGLCTDKVESHLRAAAYDALAALLVEKDTARAAAIWNNLDDWIINGFYVGSKQTNVSNPYPRDDFWATLADGFDESLAFVRLLQALVEPYNIEDPLNDTLPFPETLGSSRRMPGIDHFIDFVMQQIFADRSTDIQNPVQRDVMRWNCLRFIVTCLSTFNENLVVFANKSSIPVDSIIEPSSLEAYVVLHPFSRVMEWLFNDKVIKALLASTHHDFSVVDSALWESPLVQSLMSGIEVMDLVMKSQATYLDIVRPVITQQSSFQRSPVSNLSLASFEDAILNNLQIIPDLGYYSGTGHESLTVASLQLLKKFASSRKLAVSPAGFGQRSARSRIVGILEKDQAADRIGRSLADMMVFSPEEILVGPDAPGYKIKFEILEFLSSCLGAVSNRPTIAHILLGMTCGSTTVHITDDGLWFHGKSLFHAILILAYKYPDTDGAIFISWQSDIKTRCWDILQKLWRSPLTSAVVMNELRENSLLFMQAPTLSKVDAATSWDGYSIEEALAAQADNGLGIFCSGLPAAALQNFLRQRAAFLDYVSRELRLTVKDDLAGLKSRIQSVLLGLTTTPGGDPEPNLDIFELFDVIDFEIPEAAIPQTKLLNNANPSILLEDKDGLSLFSITLAEQLILLNIKAWKKEGFTQEQEAEAIDAIPQVLSALHDYNRRAQLAECRKENLRSWVQVLTIAVQSCEFDSTARTAFILQTLQVLLPKLEYAYNYDIFTALQLASLAETLIQKIDFTSTAFERTRTGDFSNDKLSRLFRVALVGIFSPITTTELREFCYQIVFRYIQGTTEKDGGSVHNSKKSSALTKHINDTIQNLGSHLLELICDDAYSGQGTCKISALLLLNAFVAIAARQPSKYILDSFVSLNFIGVLVDNIKHMPEELKVAPAPQVPVLLSYYDASLSLLLRICQSRVGAGYVLNAGLFSSIREARIFDVDPDIGLEFDNPNALHKYYSLIISLLRVINAIVLSREQNHQTKSHGREFLTENRHSMVAIFKRSVSVGAPVSTSVSNVKDEVLREDLAELVDCWTVLVNLTDFLEHEDTTSFKKSKTHVFS